MKPDRGRNTAKIRKETRKETKKALKVQNLNISKKYVFGFMQIVTVLAHTSEMLS